MAARATTVVSTVVSLLACLLWLPLQLWEAVRRWWLLRQLPLLPENAKLTHALLLRCAAEYASLVRLPGRHGVLVTDPMLARRVLDHGSVRDVSAYQDYRSFLGNALVLLPQSAESTASGHSLLRAALLPLFTASAARLQHNSLLDCIERLFARLEGSVRSGSAAPLYRALQHFAVDATASAFLAQRLSDADARRLIVLLEEFLAESPSAAETATAAGQSGRWWTASAMSGGRAADTPPETSRGGRLRETFEKLIDRVLTAQEAPAAAGALCVLGVLRGVRSEARAQSVGLLFAGLNSAKELAFMLGMLAHHPELQRRAREEVDTICERAQDRATATHGQQSAEQPQASDRTESAVEAGAAAPAFGDLWSEGGLPYCSLLVREALRLSPGIEHLRLRTTRDICHGSGAARLRIPSGTRVMVSPSLLHRHPRYWPAPAERPRASLYDTLLSAPDGVSSQGSGDGVQKDGCERCFLPFSSGPKGCIASQFALYEMRMLMMMTLRRFELHEIRGTQGRIRLVDRFAPSAPVEPNDSSGSD